MIDNLQKLEQFIETLNLEVTKFSKLMTVVEDLPENNFAETVTNIEKALVQVIRPKAEGLLANYQMVQEQHLKKKIDLDAWIVYQGNLVGDMSRLYGDYQLKTQRWMIRLDKDLKIIIEKKQVSDEQVLVINTNKKFQAAF